MLTVLEYIYKDAHFALLEHQGVISFTYSVGTY